MIGEKLQEKKKKRKIKNLKAKKIKNKKRTRKWHQKGTRTHIKNWKCIRIKGINRVINIIVLVNKLWALLILICSVIILECGVLKKMQKSTLPYWRRRHRVLSLLRKKQDFRLTENSENATVVMRRKLWG